MKRAAKEQGRSLNAQIIRTLETESVELERRRRSGQWLTELEQFANSLPPQEDSTPLIRQERQRRWVLAESLVVDCGVATKRVPPEPGRAKAVQLLKQEQSGDASSIAPDMLLTELGVFYS